MFTLYRSVRHFPPGRSERITADQLPRQATRRGGERLHLHPVRTRFWPGFFLRERACEVEADDGSGGIPDTLSLTKRMVRFGVDSIESEPNERDWGKRELIGRFPSTLTRQISLPRPVGSRSSRSPLTRR